MKALAGALKFNVSATHAYWRNATLLAFTGLICTALLGGMSAWFLGSVSIAGLSVAALTFNFHIPAALIRLFAVGRTAAKYGERLLGHRAALEDQVQRRTLLFQAMANDPVAKLSGWQLGNDAHLADYVEDVEDLDFAKLRIGLPLRIAGVALAAALVATAAITPWALVSIISSLGVIAVIARRTIQFATAQWEALRTSRRVGAQQLGKVLAAVVPLHAEGRWDRAAGAAIDRLSDVECRLLKVRRRLALLDISVTALPPIAALSVIAAAWASDLEQPTLLIAAFVAFSWLALTETLQTAGRSFFAIIRERCAKAALEGPTKRLPARAQADAIIGNVRHLNFSNLQRFAPDGRMLGQPVDLSLNAGSPTILQGPSGCGKTSLLKQIAGWIGGDVAQCANTFLLADARSALTQFAPHDAAIMADTVRGNLFADDACDDEIWAALHAVELDLRISNLGGLDAWLTQDALSLGEAQRLNLARTWLSLRPIILLDEPTEHLDAAQGSRILLRLVAHLTDRIVVMSSHRTLDLPKATIVCLK